MLVNTAAKRVGDGSPAGREGALGTGYGQGSITYVAYFTADTKLDMRCVRFDDFVATQRGRRLNDAPKLEPSAITHIGLSITRSTQTIASEEGDMTPFDLRMDPAWHFLT